MLGPTDKKKNVVVRLHGTGKHKPVLLIGHLDVVEANREDWTVDPFKFTEKDGYFYGRGTSDMKGDDAIMVAIAAAHETGGLPARPRHHPGAHGGRGGRLLQWPRLAAQEPPRSDRCRVRHQHRRLVGADREGRPEDVPPRRHREGLRRLPAKRHQQGRPQLRAARGQRDLPTGPGAAQHLQVPLPVRAEQRLPRLLRTTRRAVDATARGRHSRDTQDAAGSAGGRAALEPAAGQLRHAHQLRGHAA